MKTKTIAALAALGLGMLLPAPRAALGLTAGLPAPRHIMKKTAAVLPCLAQQADGKVVVSGLKELLESKLRQTGQFVLLDLTIPGTSQSPSAPREGPPSVPPSETLPPRTSANPAALPQLLFVATITDVGGNARDGQIPLGRSTVDVKIIEVSCTVSLKAIDSVTQEVVCSAEGMGTARATPWSVHPRQGDSGASPNTSGAGSGPAYTEDVVASIAKACSSGLDRAVAGALKQLAQAPWMALVADADASGIYINAGKLAGLRVGDRYFVKRVVKDVVDPATGRVLGQATRALGELHVTEVHDNFAVADSLSGCLRGDLVTDQEGSH